MSARNEEARRMRAEGAKLSEIGVAFGFSIERAAQICRGVACPIDHKRAASRRNVVLASAAPRRSPRINKDGTFIRDHYRKLSASQIGGALGISRDAVIGAARRMGLSIPKNSPPLADSSRPTSSAEVVPPDPLAGRPAEQNISSKGTVSAGSFPEGDA